MHSVTLADLAATLALHGHVLLESTSAVPVESLGQYWAATRGRTTGWHEVLAEGRCLDAANDLVGLGRWWRLHTPLIEEILVSEILTRVVAAVGVVLDEAIGRPEMGPLTHSVYVSHLEARNRTLRMLVSARGMPVDASVRLNRLRSGVERWSDLLVGQIAAACPGSARFGVDLDRTHAYARDAADQQGGAARDVSSWLLSAALRDGLSRQTDAIVVSPRENQQIADAVLVSLRPDLFDSCGTLKSLWLHRLQHGADQADRVVRSLVSPSPDEGLLSSFEAVRGSSFSRRVF